MIDFIQKISRYISAEPSHQNSPFDEFQTKLEHLVGGVVYAPGKITLSIDGVKKTLKCEAWHRSIKDCYWGIPELNLRYFKKSGRPYRLLNGRWIELKPHEWLEPILESGMCVNDVLHIRSVLSDFDVSSLGETVLESLPMTKWALVPSNPQLGVWNKIIVWYNPTEKLVARMEFYNQNLDLQRVMEFTSNLLFAGVKFPKNFKVSDTSINGQETSYEIEKIEVLKSKEAIGDLPGFREFLSVQFPVNG